MSTAGPYTLSFPMVYDELSHDFEVNCDVLGSPVVGSDPATINLRTRNGDGADLDTCANALWAELRQMFNASTLCSTYTLFKRNVNNENRDFISGGGLDLPNGSGVAANVPASQATFTWRSGGGHIMKMVLLEANLGGNGRGPLPSTGNVFINSLNGFVLSGLNFVSARDRSFPVAALNASFGQNEKIFERRFRS